MKRLTDEQSRALAIAGAIVVFLTFVVKEGLVDRWKGAVGAVDTAEYRFRTTGLAVELLRSTNGIANSLQRIEDPKRGLNPAIRVTEERINWTANEQAPAIAEELLANLGAGEGEEAGLLQAAKAGGVRYDQSIREVAQRLGTDPDPVLIASEMMPLTMQGMHYEQSVVTAIRAIRQLAVQRKDRAKSNLSLSSWLSYVLYTLGWAIGLAGQVFGPRKKSPTE
jgi:hypothetical protein